jgi:hypothetical protein
VEITVSLAGKFVTMDFLTKLLDDAVQLPPPEIVCHIPHHAVVENWVDAIKHTVVLYDSTHAAIAYTHNAVTHSTAGQMIKTKTPHSLALKLAKYASIHTLPIVCIDAMNDPPSITRLCRASDDSYRGSRLATARGIDAMYRPHGNNVEGNTAAVSLALVNSGMRSTCGRIVLNADVPTRRTALPDVNLVEISSD